VPGGPGSCINIPHKQVGPVNPPGTGFLFIRLSRLAELRWSYSNPPPHGWNLSIEVEFEVNLRPMVNRPISLGVSGAHDQTFVFAEHCQLNISQV
jgi:hypothetical protein